MKVAVTVCLCSLLVASQARVWGPPSGAELQAACYGPEPSKAGCAGLIAHSIVSRSEECFKNADGEEESYRACTHGFCGQQCGSSNPDNAGCQSFCEDHANPLFTRFTSTVSHSAFLQAGSVRMHAPEDDLAKEMTHDLEMNFNKIAPFGKEDTARELQDHAAKTQDTLVDAVENAEVAEIKRAVFRALTRLRAATIKEFDTIARLETQAIDAYNDAHHYRAENPLAHLHEDEAPVETDKLKSFH
jgi:hypothetical protein